MSPLSVADILPLEEGLFDVVIFDEASQIPLEDAIPALYRSQQMIVVGDEMQLPPSQFFASGNRRAKRRAGGQELFVYDLNADSFLNRAAAALPHDAACLALPQPARGADPVLQQGVLQGRTADDPRPSPNCRSASRSLSAAAEDAKTFAGVALQQPLSLSSDGKRPYDSQRNPGEAAYIAQLVREILNAQSGPQHRRGGLFASPARRDRKRAQRARRTTTAISARCSTWRRSARRTASSVGLFVKNLENVQGDERDIIILSVCYGPDANGRMLMNFGPINQNGGEKRLNVIFSRAKRHMMVVSSIDGAQITNTYNMGANALRKYLTYAQAASVGDADLMAAALAEYSGAGAREADSDGQLVADQIAQELRARGFVALRNYGQSALKCHIAAKRAGHGAADDFQLAIQVDDGAHMVTRIFPRATQ